MRRLITHLLLIDDPLALPMSYSSCLILARASLLLNDHSSPYLLPQDIMTHYRKETIARTGTICTTWDIYISRGRWCASTQRQLLNRSTV